MRFKEARGRKVVSTDNAEALGKVEAYVIDPRKRRVTALRLAKVKGDRTFLSWNDLQAFGTDAVTVDSVERLRPPADDAEERAASKELQAIGKLVLSASGTALGKVEDVEFDRASGAIVGFDLADGSRVVADRIIGLGAHAAVVADAAEE
jgi:uncharacterized protein YrrD